MKILLKIAVSCFIFLSSICAAENCDKDGVLIYEDLGCTPEYSGSSKCPTKYKCPSFGTSESDKCHFKGKVYNLNENIPNPGDPCNDVCRCGQKFHDGNKTSIICQYLACDMPRIPFGCQVQYYHDGCCPGVKCQSDEIVCRIGNKQLTKRESYSPPDTCYDCGCQKGFTGKIEEPFCRRRVCSAQVRNLPDVQKFCAPVYYKSNTLCCPHFWLCRDGSEKVKGTAKSDETCRYGDQNIKVGQSFERTNVTDYRYSQTYAKIDCECLIPPFVTCIYTPPPQPKKTFTITKI